MTPQSSQGKVEWMQEPTYRMGYAEGYRQGSASRDPEIKRLRDALQTLVGMYHKGHFISCITPGSRQETKSKPSSQVVYEAWDTALSLLGGAE